jgi:hypothetical protein
MLINLVTALILVCLPLIQGLKSTDGGINGRVVDSRRGTPLSMVQIRTVPVSGVAITDAGGNYFLQGLKLGRYVVVASKSGYSEGRVTVNVTSEKTTADILLVPRGAPTQHTRGLVSYYPLDGALRDLVRTGPDVRLYNVHWIADRFGRPNHALHFNGTSSYARLGNALDDVFTRPNATFTIAGWANTDSYPEVAGAGCIIAKSFGGESGPYQWSIAHDSDGKIKGAVMGKLDASTFTIMESDVIPIGRWFHFALVFDGSLPPEERVKVYVDGIPGKFSRRKGTLGSSAEPSDQEITLGATHWPHNPLAPANLYEGAIDAIRIYDTALGQDEIQALLSSEKK